MPNITHHIDFPQATTPLGLDRDWLLTNGTGAFAMGSLPGIATRRYHGLLVASTLPPAGRVVLLNQMLEQILVPAEGKKTASVDFATCPFVDGNGGPVFTPAGFSHLKSFEKGECVEWRYRAELPQNPGAFVAFARRLHIHWKTQAATITYRVQLLGGKRTAKTPASITGLHFRVAPLISLRDFHTLLLKDHAGPFDVASKNADTITVRRAGNTATFHAPAAAFGATNEWWYALHYAFESKRGQDFREDLFLPGWFDWKLPAMKITEGEHETEQGGVTFAITVSLGETAANPSDGSDSPRLAHLDDVTGYISRACELASFKNTADESIDAGTLARTLAIASDDFIVDRFVDKQKLATIIAGYPWFADWGRDTFIALTGLLLCTGRFDEARSTLRAFAGHLQDGLVPNFFDERSAAANYNTVDASLWFIHAAIDYVRASGDQEAWKEWLSPACITIVEAYIRGTSFGIKMGGDCLIAAGSPQTQLTWMDAKCGDVVFTPRHGKAVEINALWYNALAELAQLLKPINASSANHYERLTDRIGRSFAKVFWNEADNCLYDHVYTDENNVDRPDPAIRPNQIFAVSLANSPLPRKRQVEVVEAVRRELLTPFGLRTLAAGDKAYKPHYVGGPFERDSAYHQGTVWPWLIGPYVQAVLRAERFSPKSKAHVVEALAPLVAQLMGQGLGHLHEIHDADAPHTPAGCPAQAWSVASVLQGLSLLRHPQSPLLGKA